MASILPEDPTLDEIRAAIAPLLPFHAAFDGWGEDAVASAAREIGVDPDIAGLAFKGGAVDLVDAWIESVDEQMAARLPAETLAEMKIRERIRRLVETRLEIAAPHREALRRAMAILAMPRNLPRAARISWRTADGMWRLAGDVATDYNHYTKRAILAGVYGSTLTVFLDDESEDFAETRAFLSRRIDNVMQFEKTKAQFAKSAERLPSLSRFIGRLRYPAR